MKNLSRPVLVAALSLLAGPAFGATHLLTSLPRSGAVGKSPAHIVLRFSQALEPAFSGALLLDAQGRNLSGNPATVDGRVMRLSPDRLAPGRYRVVWHATGDDSRHLDGSFRFTVRR